MGAANQYCILADIDDPETSQVRDGDSPSTAQSICVLPVRAEVAADGAHASGQHLETSLTRIGYVWCRVLSAWRQ